MYDGSCQYAPSVYKFTGKERDTETNLDYFGARYYSNALGRFITPDWAAKATAVPYAEFADPQSLNLYSYVRNNPVTKADADGHACSDPKKGCTITVQFRAFIPPPKMDLFKGDNRNFTNAPDASSRLSTTATVKTPTQLQMAGTR